MSAPDLLGIRGVRRIMGTMNSELPADTAAMLAEDAHRGAELAPLAYTKKPVTVEAIRFDGTLDSANRILEFVNGRDKQGDALVSVATVGGKLEVTVVIDTREGAMSAVKGDYIIREPFPTDDRKFYPCKGSIFLESYDRA